MFIKTQHTEVKGCVNPPLVPQRIQTSLEKEAVWFIDYLTHLSISVDVNNHNKKALHCWNIEQNVPNSHICFETIGNLWSSKNISHSTYMIFKVIGIATLFWELLL